MGGAQTALCRLLTHLSRDSFAPVVVCLYNGDSVVAQEIRQLGIPVLDMKMTSKWRLGALVRFYLSLRHIHPVIMHTWMFHADVLGRIIGRLAHVPIIVTSRHNVNIGGKHREVLKRWTTGLDDKVVAVCELAREAEIRCAGAAPDKVVKIYNGINAENYVCDKPLVSAQARPEFGFSSSTRVIGYVGRLHPQKGLSDLLAAMPEIRDHFPSVRLLLVGQGELADVLAQEAQMLGISNEIVFAGQRTDVTRVLATLDVFVLPSRWEGLPNAVLEAMAAGLPVVATKVGGVSEAVIDGMTGLLVPPSDPGSLAQSTIKLLHDTDLRCRMGQAGQDYVRAHFDIGNMVKQTEALYQELVAEKGLG